MNVIMVAEDINKNGSFKQSKGEVLCTICTLAFVKHFYPDFHTTFFVDEFTKKYYESFGILRLFDEVNETLLRRELKIDKDVFWAAGKLLAQRETKGPTLTLDLDFFLSSDLEVLGVFDSDISCLWVEEIEDKYYHQPNKGMELTGLDWKYDWDNYGINVSFLYLKDEEFKNLYCDTAIQYMESLKGKLQKNNDFHENTKYILFAEQYMLNQLARKNEKKVKVLIDDFYNTSHLSYVEPLGLHMNTCGSYFYHMGYDKKRFRANDEFGKWGTDLFYDTTIKTITDPKFIEIIQQIYNLPENEGRFCKLD